MSADRWSYCPNCQERAEKEQAEREQKAEQSYGKVSAEEYLRLLGESHAVEEQDRTLREDWELYLEGFTLYVRYSCSCDACKLNYQYKADVSIKKSSPR